MVLARAWSVALHGVVGALVEVEADLAFGLPGLTIIGLPDASVTESRDRVRAAVLNAGAAWPARRITVGLSPATLRKVGSGFDLAIASAVLAADGSVPASALRDRVLVGELGLDGRVRPVRGMLPAVLAASAAGVATVVVPLGNAAEARLVPDVRVEPVTHLRDVIALLRGEPVDVPAVDAVAGGAAPAESELDRLDLADVRGQDVARRAVEVAAAGGHHMLLLGPPGTGKTMLAARLPGLLPELPMAAALELTAVHSVAGLLPASTPLVRRPPFRSPHHTATVAALVGGGSGLLRPGEVSLAHHGILLLDEAPEFSSAALDALRQPLESGRVELARAGLAATFPACCQLVLTANPCPCAQPAESCSCGPTVKRRYLGRLSGPLLDRIDLQITVLPVSRAAMAASSIPESSAVVAERVAQARQAAAARYAGTPWRLNRDVPGVELRRRWPVATTAQRQLLPHLDAGSLTLRGYDRVVRTAWTLADLNGRPVPERAEIAEALSLRGVPTAYAHRGGHDAA